MYHIYTYVGRRGESVCIIEGGEKRGSDGLRKQVNGGREGGREGEEKNKERPVC